MAGAMTATMASVAAPEASAADFYMPPANIADTPGAVLKTQSIPLVMQIPGIKNQWPGNAKKVMYTSRDIHDKAGRRHRNSRRAHRTVDRQGSASDRRRRVRHHRPG